MRAHGGHIIPPREPFRKPERCMLGRVNDPDARSILAQASIFAGLDARQLDTLAAMAVRKRFRTRDIVLRKGDPALQIFIIVRGRLKAITSGGEGRQAALSIMGPGEVFGEVAVLDGEPRSATITA